MKVFWNVYTKIIIGVFVLILIAAGGVNYYSKKESDVRFFKVTDGVLTYNKVQVDSLLLFVIHIDQSAIATFADNSTYFIGSGISAPTLTSSALRQFFLPKCKLVGYSIMVQSSVISSTETFSIYLRKNNTTDYLITSDLYVNSTAFVPTYFSGWSLDNDYAKNDKVEVKIVSPALATNPTAVNFSVKLYFKPLL